MSMIFFQSSVGMFAITNREDFRCDLLLDGMSLGIYEDWREAINALCSGEVFQPRDQFIDFDTLDIPNNPLEWEYVA